MRLRAALKAISLAVLPGLSAPLYAQGAGALSLDQILERLQANLNRYDSSVPSLFCDEHVSSSQVAPHQPDESTITDSIFRLKRTAGPGGKTMLAESREIRSVNGKPATSQDVDGPAMLHGAFEGGLAVVSLDQRACMRYQLEPTRRRHPNEPYIVRFTSTRDLPATATCLLQEKSKGRVLIDPASMQITHLEIDTPRHTISEGDSFASRMVGRRVVTVEYDPVELGGETFWMPSSITMRVTSGGFHMIVWSYEATYRNYHKLEVTSRILPGLTPVH
jgi:hypothetical protein